ncbi:response regulator transcription factor [Sutterella sp.]|uniref:response regulator transcription factor n=1 Tax=Sutterella sp. TaxID=1981025 RepID=UPI0026E0ACB2|nr:response regulator [Sutterella sp.]MDO5532441.1 response regulator [Sutterella sp.]
MTQKLTDGTLIRIVDDDEEVRDALSFMLGCKGWKTVAYATAEDFLKGYSSVPPGCVLLDIRMPGMSGLELQARMKEMKLTLPIIFVTGHADVPTAVRTLKMGAFDFLEKPVDAAALTTAIEAAVSISVAEASGSLSGDAIIAVIDEMSPREREITCLLAKGLSNRDIAEHLSLAERTVQGHRNNIYHKLRVHNLKQFTELLDGISL